MHAMDHIVLPALQQFGPELIVVASGLDANGVDPLARILLHSDSYREMTFKLMAAADELCDGKLTIIHEGGYAEAYVPFCGLAVCETLAGERTAVEDPFLELIKMQQPAAHFIDFQKQVLDNQKSSLSSPS